LTEVKGENRYRSRYVAPLCRYRYLNVGEGYASVDEVEQRYFNLDGEASRQLHVDEVLQFLITADQPFTLVYILLKRLSTQLLRAKKPRGKNIKLHGVHDQSKLPYWLLTDGINRSRSTEPTEVPFLGTGSKTKKEKQRKTNQNTYKRVSGQKRNKG
jgi:hypothetical protein